MKRQGDEEVNKGINQTYIFKQICLIFGFENKPSSGAKRKIKIKLKVRYKHDKKTTSHSFPHASLARFVWPLVSKVKLVSGFHLKAAITRNGGV